MVKLFWKNSNLCDHNPPTLQTDGQTDRRHAIARPRFALTSASRGKNGRILSAMRKIRMLWVLLLNTGKTWQQPLCLCFAVIGGRGRSHWCREIIHCSVSVSNSWGCWRLDRHRRSRHCVSWTSRPSFPPHRYTTGQNGRNNCTR